MATGVDPAIDAANARVAEDWYQWVMERADDPHPPLDQDLLAKDWHECDYGVHVLTIDGAG